MGMNVVVMEGHLTRDPELKYLPNSTPVANFGLAVNERWNDKESGEQKERVCFVDCEVWQRSAEIASEYLTKGSHVLVRGRLQLDQWENEEGQNRSKHKIRIDDLRMLGKSGNGNSESNSNSKAVKTTAKPKTTKKNIASDASADDEIPF